MGFKVGMVVAYRNENYVVLDKKEILLNKDQTDTFFQIKNLITQTTLLVNQNQLQAIKIDRSRSNSAQKIDNISQSQEQQRTSPSMGEDTIAGLKSALDSGTVEFIPKRLQQQDNTSKSFDLRTTANDLNLSRYKTTVVEPISITNDMELNQVEEDDFAPTTMRINNISLVNDKKSEQNYSNHSNVDFESKSEDSQMFINSFDNPDLTDAKLQNPVNNKNKKNYRINFSQETKSLFNQPSESGSDILKKSKVFRSFKMMTIWLLILFSLVIVFSAVVLVLWLMSSSKVIEKLAIIGLPVAWGIFLLYFFTYIVYNLVRQYKKIAHYHYQLTKSNRSIKELKKQMENEKIAFSKLYKKFQDFESNFYKLDINLKSSENNADKKKIIN
ncbi:hypothetical protein [Spiroplasma alleghenense]|uniref:Transmembrane protein n=1 Tax=Spiroplasma alleghenense TaxID=216931 RepID=A0A345Z4C2_9MOLU|nr:hypothetical protein [Spiroplasma alleghenense]AXK51451.1 hypothetical protein SALLE_v1c07810 [Spiroplasma alleghenense]